MGNILRKIEADVQYKDNNFKFVSIYRNPSNKNRNIYTSKITLNLYHYTKKS